MNITQLLDMLEIFEERKAIAKLRGMNDIEEFYSQKIEELKEEINNF